MDIKEIKKILLERIEYHRKEYRKLYDGLLRTDHVYRYMKIHGTLSDDLRFIYNVERDEFYEDLNYSLRRLNKSIEYNKEKYNDLQKELKFLGYCSSTVRYAIMHKKIYEEEIQYKSYVEYILKNKNEI